MDRCRLAQESTTHAVANLGQPFEKHTLALGGVRFFRLEQGLIYLPMRLPNRKPSSFFPFGRQFCCAASVTVMFVLMGCSGYGDLFDCARPGCTGRARPKEVVDLCEGVKRSPQFEKCKSNNENFLRCIEDSCNSQGQYRTSDACIPEANTALFCEGANESRVKQNFVPPGFELTRQPRY
jgi:hypothetical protein